MKKESLIDLTADKDESTIIICSDESSSDMFESPIKDEQCDEFKGTCITNTSDDDFELAKSLQISEYINAMRENELLKENTQKTKQTSTKSISSFFSKKRPSPSSLQLSDDDICIERIDLKGMEKATKSRKKKRSEKEKEEEEQMIALNKSYLHNVLAKELELTDPTPNIQLLFDLFNKEFFYDSLKFITVKWSKKMTLCAGICRMKGLKISISLSQPLLSLRQRSDTINTLLHEMIHAYLFVTRNYFDRDDHGPEFKKHMNRINKLAHSKITIYHTFHDEVESCRKWWWRCDGPCRNKPPYYGYVKRAMNRPPQKADWWFEKHQKECGGHYHLVKSPNDNKTTIHKLLTK